MWVIYCDQTGEEIERIEDHREARLYIRNITPGWQEFTYSLRWED